MQFFQRTLTIHSGDQNIFYLNIHRSLLCNGEMLHPAEMSPSNAKENNMHQVPGFKLYQSSNWTPTQY